MTSHEPTPAQIREAFLSDALAPHMDNMLGFMMDLPGVNPIQAATGDFADAHIVKLARHKEGSWHSALTAKTQALMGLGQKTKEALDDPENKVTATLKVESPSGKTCVEEVTVQGNAITSETFCQKHSTSDKDCDPECAPAPRKQALLSLKGLPTATQLGIALQAVTQKLEDPELKKEKRPQLLQHKKSLEAAIRKETEIHSRVQKALSAFAKERAEKSALEPRVQNLMNAYAELKAENAELRSIVKRAHPAVEQLGGYMKLQPRIQALISAHEALRNKNRDLETELRSQKFKDRQQFYTHAQAAIGAALDATKQNPIAATTLSFEGRQLASALHGYLDTLRSVHKL